MIQILFIDDESNFLEVGKTILEDTIKCRVDMLVDATLVVSHLNSTEYDAVISDYSMPDITGLELLEQIRKVEKNIPFILLTGHSSEDIAIKSVNQNMDLYLKRGGEKPDDLFTENLSIYS